MKKIFLSILMSIPGSLLFAADTIDKIPNNNQVIAELKDVYHAFKINHIISDEKETLNMIAGEDPDGLKKMLAEYNKANTKINTQDINDKKLRSYIDSFLAMTAHSYQLLQLHGLESHQFQKYDTAYGEMYDRYMDYLTTRYTIEHFVKLTEDEYWKKIDKANYIHASQYQSFDKSKKTDIATSRKLIEGIIAQTTDPQEQAIYKIALADQYVKYDTASGDAKDKAIALYKSIVDAHAYSLYIFEAWLKWRLVSQESQYGLSKTSDIPNDLYDNLREQAAYTVLEYVSKNPNDDMAKNEFLVLATHDIVRRFGDYPYGNQNTVEYHQTFDEGK